MRQLQFKGTGNKLTGIPKTSCCFGCCYINYTSNYTNYQAGNIVYFFKIHKEFGLFIPNGRERKNREGAKLSAKEYD